MDVPEADHASSAMQLEEIKLFRTKTREGSWSDVQQQRHSFTTRVANWALDDGAGDRLPVVQSEKADSISLQPAGMPLGRNTTTITLAIQCSVTNDNCQCLQSMHPPVDRTSGSNPSSSIVMCWVWASLPTNLATLAAATSLSLVFTGTCLLVY